MKTRPSSRFEIERVWRTLSYLCIATLLIIIALWVGIRDNIVMISLLLGGIILFLYASLYLWAKVTYYSILAVASLIILILDIMWPFINEDIAMSSGLVCFAGIIAGITGIFRFRKYN